MALHVTRRLGKSVDLFVPGLGPIRVTFIDWIGRQARLAIDAPRKVLILRTELEEREREELAAGPQQKGTREIFEEPSPTSPAPAPPNEEDER
jgi:sRNA-binding carbon storage regulator CsrA